MEQFDKLDCTGARTGELIGRDDAHANGVWHGAFHGLILYRREARGMALFQLRSGRKQIAPGSFDVSAGGHYAAGESSDTAGPREIAEELGLAIGPDRFVPVGRRVFVHCFTPGVREFEFQDVFLLPLSGRPGGLILQPEEVEAVLELEIEQGIQLFSGARPEATGTLLRSDGNESPRTVTASDFVPSVDAYYGRLLVLARRYLSGERQGLFI